ncbi:unnamed protein product [Vicia faba]|uniref:Uncharacterized protein n=1 Tax=Vicia faba TaxID=3906 RepID=A0AAV1A2G1_VICFA|nr:unnamed protein product [Vicia faba]
MLSSRCLLFLLLPLFFTINSDANDQLIFRNHKCNNDLGNFTGDSAYPNNRDTVLGKIYSDREIDYGFYNFSYGEEPDIVNAIGFCRGDVNPNDCRDCLKSSAVLLTERCPIQKEAIGYYDLCTLRYSNASIFGVMNTNGYVYNSGKKAVVDDAFNQTLSGLLDELKSAGAEGDSRKKFAEKSVKVIESNSSNNDTIYGLVQCTPDLTKQNCTTCLDLAFDDLSFWCKEMKGCLYLGPSCSVRYDIVQFYQSIVNNTESPAPQPSSQAISPKASSGNSTTNPSNTKGKKRVLRTAIAIVLALVVAAILVVGGCIYCERRKPKPQYTAEIQDAVQETYEDEDEVKAGNDLKVGDLLQFDFETIKLATGNFSDASALGQGGFGTVYKGTLDGLDVAIKRLANNSKQGETEFKNEVLLTGKLQHRNLVKLLGFCLHRGERLLIYEFVPNKSLDYIIFDSIKRANLNWERRLKIIKDIARDFGIAKLFAPNQTHGMTSTVIGTYGYMAPEYIKHGEFSIKSDVFSFGVIVLEIIYGRRNTKFRDGENIKDLLDNAWENWKTGTSLDIVDPMLEQDLNKDEKKRCIHVGLLCVQEDIDVRPTMSSVLLMLSSTSYPLPEPSEPPFLMQPKRALSISLSDYSGLTKSSDSGSGSQFTQGSTTKSSVTDQ